MGFKSLIMILIISITTTNCTTVNFVSPQDNSEKDFSMFNHLGSGRKSNIFLLNGEEISTKYVMVKNDSLFYSDFQDTLSISLSEIERVQIIHLGKKIGFGLVAGIVSFVVSTLAITFAIGGDGTGILLAMPFGAILGVAIFIHELAYGGIIEYNFNYEFDDVKRRQMENYKKQIKYFEEKVKRDSTNLGKKNNSLQKFE